MSRFVYSMIASLHLRIKQVPGAGGAGAAGHVSEASPC
jgi:hypothetical protein